MACVCITLLFAHVCQAIARLPSFAGPLEASSVAIKAVRPRQSQHRLMTMPAQQPLPLSSRSSFDSSHQQVQQQHHSQQVPPLLLQQQLTEPLLPGLPFIEQQLQQPAQACASYTAADMPPAAPPHYYLGMSAMHCSQALPQMQQPRSQQQPCVQQLALQDTVMQTQQQVLQQGCDVDLAAAVAEEVAVYDLQRQQELEHQQQVAAVAEAATRVSQVAGDGSCTNSRGTGILGAAALFAGPADGSARRIAFASRTYAAAAGVSVPEEASFLPGDSSSSRPTSSAAVCQNQQQQQPLSPASAVRQWGHLLTPFEQCEILSFEQVWFVGKPSAPKIKGGYAEQGERVGKLPEKGGRDRSEQNTFTLLCHRHFNCKCMFFCPNLSAAETGGAELNHGYDDSRGDYITVVNWMHLLLCMLTHAL